MNPRETALGRLLATPLDQRDGLFAAGLDALDHGLYEAIATRCEEALALPGALGDARIHQLLGVARRGELDSAAAHAAFATAARLRPGDPLLSQSVAQTALEAGYPALALFATARQLAPRNPQIILGEAAALLAEGQAGEALARLGKVLGENPGWLEGHRSFALVAASGGMSGRCCESLEAALRAYPADPNLWQTAIEVLLKANANQQAREMVARARQAAGPLVEFDRAEAVALSEGGDPVAAQAIHDRLGEPTKVSELIHPLRNAIRLGRFDQAAALAERSFPAFDELGLWPYRALVWRLIGDPRWHWLEGDERLIGVHDISAALGSLDQLAECLRAIHASYAEPIDQSVRGGTQTDGNVLARAEPEIRRLRAAIIDTVRAHVAQLPPPDPRHPTLLATRGPIRIQGAWSVRLSGGGFHVDHVHPLGWISSAFYVAVPRGEQGIGGAGGQDGWLTFGECRRLLPDHEGFRVVEPGPGRIALFPSTMWHGTRPFGAGERMTVAIDIDRPLQ